MTTYLPTAQAVKLLAKAMAPKTAAARVRAAQAVLRQLPRMALHPDLPFDAFRAGYLRDCLEAGEPDKARVFLDEPRFSADDQRALLEVVVALYLAMGETRRATDWIGDVSYVFGAKAVRGLASKPQFKKLATSKAYLKVAGKDAPRNFFVAHFAEVTRMWKRGEYDHWKDAVQDARGLVLEARSLGAELKGRADKHLAAVTKRITKEFESDPGLRQVLKGLM